MWAQRIRPFSIAVLIFTYTYNASAAHYSSATLAAWDQQVLKARRQLERETQDPNAFLIADKSAPAIDSTEPSGHPIPEGLIHHWFGTALIPHANAAALLAVLQNYEAYPQLFPPALMEALLMDHDGGVYTYRLKFIQKALGYRSGLLGNFQSRYVALDAGTGYVVTDALKFTELQNPGKPNERELSLAESKGFMERSLSIMRYRQTNEGVIVRIESITLSRDVPGSIRWLVNPFIRRFARQTMSSTLDRLTDGVSAEYARGPQMITRR